MKVFKIYNQEHTVESLAKICIDVDEQYNNSEHFFSGQEYLHFLLQDGFIEFSDLLEIKKLVQSIQASA